MVGRMSRIKRRSLRKGGKKNGRRMSRIKRRSVRRTRSLRKGGKKNGRRMRGGGCDGGIVGGKSFKVETENTKTDKVRIQNHLRKKEKGNFIIRKNFDGGFFRLDLNVGAAALIMYPLVVENHGERVVKVDLRSPILRDMFDETSGEGIDAEAALHDFACKLHDKKITLQDGTETTLIYLPPEQNNIYDTVIIQGGLSASLKESFLKANSENGGGEGSYSKLQPGTRAEADKSTLDFMEDFTNSTLKLDKVAFNINIGRDQAEGIFKRAQPKQDGTFILRKKVPESDGRRSVSVSMFHDTLISHFNFTVNTVENEDNYFGTGSYYGDERDKKNYGSLTDMLRYFKVTPLHGDFPNTKMSVLLYDRGTPG